MSTNIVIAAFISIRISRVKSYITGSLLKNAYIRTRMVFSAPIENMNNIFYCLVKFTYVGFLALTLITTNYYSSNCN